MGRQPQLQQQQQRSTDTGTDTNTTQGSRQEGERQGEGEQESASQAANHWRVAEEVHRRHQGRAQSGGSCIRPAEASGPREQNQ